MAHLEIKASKVIGLLTPYTGGNFGDAAIQEAVIKNIRKRCPDALIYGFTMSPKETERRHEILSFPISAVSRPYYVVTAYSHSNVVNKHAEQDKKLFCTLKKILKKIPIVPKILKTVYLVSSMVFKEIVHVVKSCRIASSLELLIVSGGGQLDDYWGGALGHPYNLFKWAIISKLTKTKLVFLSVGACSIASRLSWFFISWALRLAKYRSYRDKGSKDLLDRISVTRSDPIVPDLAFGFEFPNNPGSTQKEAIATVGVSPISYLNPHYWPKANEVVYKNYIHVLTSFVFKLIEWNYKILLFSTADPDRRVIGELLEKLNNFPLAKSGKIEQIQGEVASDLTARLSGVNLVIASRLHGVLISHLMNKPVLAISYDRKIDDYMRDMCQSQYCLDINGVDLGDVMKRFNLLQKEADSIKINIGKKIRNYKTLLENQYDCVLGTRDVG